jgi:DNA-binding NtrC family response regulator
MQSSAASPRILIVDDEPLILKLLRDMVLLSSDGARVEIAVSAREAFERLCNTEYDVVLSDIHMEDMSGIDLVRETRTLSPCPTIVLMTGEESFLQDAFKSGAYTCLRKPLPWDLLTDVLRRAVDYNRLHREAERLRQVQKFTKEPKGDLWDDLHGRWRPPMNEWRTRVSRSGGRWGRS